MIIGDIGLHVRPVGTVPVRETVPVNPLSAVTVIPELAPVPTNMAAGEVAVMVKSVIVNVAVVECRRVPLVAVMLRI